MPPHNHGSWAAIRKISGHERNHVYWRGGGGGLIRERKMDPTPGDTLYIPEDVVRVVECIGDKDVFGLRIYCGDVLGLDRSMWAPIQFGRNRSNGRNTETLVRRATAAARVPLT